VHARNKNRQTPLHSASLYGRPDIARVLLDHGATMNSEDNSGRTPLHLVAEGKYNLEQDRIRVVQLLLERGADVNALDNAGRTPLHVASYNWRAELVQVLLDGNATTNSKNYRRRTPLHAVAEGGNYHSRGKDVLVAQLLLGRGAGVDVVDDHNQTPLHLASYLGRIEMVLLLLKAGANASAKDARGQTPLHLVSQYSHGDGVHVAQLLLKYGADVNVQDKNHATPIDLSSYHGKTKITSLLLQSTST
jgi:ankyrin repeat protein